MAFDAARFQAHWADGIAGGFAVGQAIAACRGALAVEADDQRLGVFQPGKTLEHAD